MSKKSQVVALCVGLWAMTFVGGCGNSTTNETGSSGSGASAPPDAPKSQQEFFDQSKAKTAKPPGK